MEQTRYAVNMLKGQTATQMNLDRIKEWTNKNIVKFKRQMQSYTRNRHTSYIAT